LFLDGRSLQTALEAGRNSPEFWSTATVVADAKAWDVSLDRPTKVQNKREYPPEQIEWYLIRSERNWGVLTNGQIWRLIPRQLSPQQRRFQTYLECELPPILDGWLAHAGDLGERAYLLDEFLQFYLFFGPAGHAVRLGRKPLVERANEGSSEYRLGVSEGLKGQTFKALQFCIEVFLAYGPNGLYPASDLLRCREESFILLLRLLFIMFAEDRRLLPYKVNSSYTKNRSLGRLRDDVAGRLDRIGRRQEDDFSRHETALWDDLLDLFDLIDQGRATYGVPAYDGGLFDAAARPFLRVWKLSDWHLARVIDHLGRAADPDRPSAGPFRVDYRDLAIQHLGGIYEGLLEHRPKLATEKMVVYTRRHGVVREERVLPASKPAPDGFDPTEVEYPPGSIYLAKDKGERRAFGSYYTPDHIVDAIVRQTLGPVCAAITDELRAADKAGAAPADFAERALALRVLDPAMGSGHFLLRACQYLAEEIATNPYTESDHTADAGDESALGYWKRQVIERCLYGVDLNPMAVELAKLALWLETVAADRPLTFLDHHLRHGNSLIGAGLDHLAALPGETGMFAEGFAKVFDRKLPALLGPLAAIRELPSESAKQVKAKESRFAEFQRAVEPFWQLADLWCAAVIGDDPDADQYHAVLDEVDKSGRFKRLAVKDWFKGATQLSRGLAAFHWELAFPDAYFAEGGRRDRPGFDAVIGNPPYEVLSERESGQDLSALRAFINAEPAYAPSQRGKNNLYKLFICRALDLLAGGGRLGFITPMAVLGDDQAADLRRAMLQAGRFTAVEAFPQKDDPRRRVFPEAKLSTAVFILKKGTGDDLPFRARIHPGRDIEDGSPGMHLTTAAIPLYDPSNCTIVSCSQADWDLATRLMRSGRMGRLGEFAKFFQGEVNETTERARGKLTKDPKLGRLVTRGANICLYVTRPASQGNDILLKVESFLRGKGPNTKAFHHRYPRVGLQESSPQNNFRRIIAAMTPAGEFFNHTVNYCTEKSSKTDLHFVAALLNSTLSDWYFRLGSTNAHVSHYQLYNLPCPHFAKKVKEKDAKLQAKAEAAVAARRPEDAMDVLRPLLAEPPFSPAVRAVIVAAVRQIMRIEADRGEIARTDRSALDPDAQPYQDLIDQLLYAMAGLSAAEVRGLEERYATML
jgi:type I restriction-modification system DNA methylase subunit